MLRTPSSRWVVLHHPGGNPGANLKSISHRCRPIMVAFVWELTKETIVVPLGCLQGGRGGALSAPRGARAQPRAALLPRRHPGDNIRANGVRFWGVRPGMPPDSGGSLRGCPRLGGAICPNVVSRVVGKAHQWRGKAPPRPRLPAPAAGAAPAQRSGGWHRCSPDGFWDESFGARSAPTLPRDLEHNKTVNARFWPWLGGARRHLGRG